MWIKMYILLRRALHTKIQDYNASPDISETPIIWACSDYLNINSLLHSWAQIIIYCIVGKPFQAHYEVWVETLKNQSLHIYTMTDSLSWQNKKIRMPCRQCALHWLFAFRVPLLTCLFLLLLHDFSISELQKKKHSHSVWCTLQFNVSVSCYYL